MNSRLRVRHLNEHEAFIKGLPELAKNKGLSSRIYFDEKTNCVIKVQYLLRIPTLTPHLFDNDYFSIQMGNETVRKYGEHIARFFLKEQVVVPRRETNPSKFFQKLVETVIYSSTHDFLDEIEALTKASDAQITPPLRDWYVCNTGRKVAIGVYVQEKAEVFGAMGAVRVLDQLKTHGPAPFTTLFKRAAQSGVLHLDVNPSNLAFYKGELCFLDFGLSSITPPVEMSTELCAAFFYSNMLAQLRAMCTMWKDANVYCMGCVVVPDSLDHEILSTEFLSKLQQECLDAEQTTAGPCVFS